MTLQGKTKEWGKAHACAFFIGEDPNNSDLGDYVDNQYRVDCADGSFVMTVENDDPDDPYYYLKFTDV